MRDFTEEIDNALDVLFKLEKQSKKKNILERGKNIYIQVVIFKTPFCAPRKRIFLKLKHSLYGDSPEVCLFVPNQETKVPYKKTTDELIDFCVDHYTNLLEKHKIKGITTVMPLKQLQAEYGAYEMRRKLVQRFDVFLCKNSLLYNHRFLTSLGKAFRLANKEPFGVPFPKGNIDFDPNFQENINRVLFASSFYIRRSSDNYSIPVGNSSNTKAELKENLQMILNQILTENVIPGGFKNIKALYLWPSQSKPIPLYMSTEIPRDLKVRIRQKRRRPKGVEGELSTQPGKKVFVMPSGEVFVTKSDKSSNEAEVQSESEDDDSFDDGSGNEEEEDEEQKKRHENSDDDDEEDTDAVERMREIE